ncbi:Oidioi.mRNA.OKI2018_I69.chr2.g7318.t1.cds [Oikopleura dioica]|uniref:long-chain-fatty-acid--CoA ligase n=1 Tax=Oikopleura dioica TaxID=34765 RepID=A0ABN7T6F1_OIKDI|nr:Oidioi.mRNA.OKI2018_I69.chr2.g7318.t1.cds [Oikopleura dioica]
MTLCKTCDNTRKKVIEPEHRIHGLENKKRPLKTLDEPQTYEADANTFARHNILCEGKGVWTLPEGVPQTLMECFQQGLKAAGEDGVCCGTPNAEGKYVTQTYGELKTTAQRLGNAFNKLGLINGKSKIAIFSANCFEYDAIIIGGYFQNLCNVSLYDTLGEEAVKFILEQAHSTLFQQNQNKLDLILKVKPEHLKTIVMLREYQTDSTEVNIMSFSDFVSTGDSDDSKNVLPTSSDMATINYTSGTTGNPKGVILTHKNICTVAIGILVFSTPEPWDNTDIWFSYLPMAHIFERAVHCVLMSIGAQWWFSSGDIKKLLPELAVVRPTIFGSVPRVMNKIFDKIKATMAESKIKGWLLDAATSSKRERLDNGQVTNDTLWDCLVLKKVQNLLGGRIRTWVSGAAPLNPTVRGFIREIFSCYVIEAYGQTENVGCGTATSFVNYQIEDGCVGPPQPWNEIKLADVPEMEYFGKDGKGEVCFRGDNTMQGYYNDPEKTAEAIDEDGWLHSGDIGQWMENGTIKIIDRKKHIYKTALGEYIAPERIEGIYSNHPQIAQMFLWGSSLQATNVAIIVPEEDKFMKEYGKGRTFEEACTDPDTIAKFLTAINEFARQDGVKGYEVPKAIYLEHELFSIENELLTPTQKAKRPSIQKKYMSIMEKLYEELNN